MPSKSKTESQSQSSNTVNADQMATFKSNLANVQNNGANFTAPYTGQMVAGLTPAQLQAQGILTGVATDPTLKNNITGATSAIQGILANPANPNITAKPIDASTIAGTDLSPYLNPFQKNVIDTTMANFDTLNKQHQLNTNQSATAAGTFGGSRSGVANALTNQLDTQAEAPVIAGLNASNFNTALGSAAQDAATRNAIGEFNSGQDVNAQQATFGNKTTNANTGMNAADTIANLTGANLNIGNAQGGILGAVGGQQQQQQQNELDAALQMWLEGKSLSAQQQAMVNQALAMMPIEQTTNNNSTSTTTQQPGAAQIVGALGGAAMMAAGMPAGGGGMFSSLFGGSAPSLGGSAFSIPQIASTVSMPQTAASGYGQLGWA